MPHCTYFTHIQGLGTGIQISLPRKSNSQGGIFITILRQSVSQPLSEYGFAYGLKTETCQYSKIYLVSPTVKERKHILSEYRLSTVSIVSKYGLDWSAVRFGLVPSTVSLSP